MDSLDSVRKKNAISDLRCLEFRYTIQARPIGGVYRRMWKSQQNGEGRCDERAIQRLSAIEKNIAETLFYCPWERIQINHSGNYYVL